MKKVNKILLGSVLPFLGLSVAVPVIATSCSVQSATIVESKWKLSTEQQSNPGFSLNDKNNELTFDFLKDNTVAEGDPTPTLEIIKSVIFENNKITSIITNAIVDFDKFQSIELEGKEPSQNINDKIATFNFVLSRKDGLEISHLKLIIKNYLIDGTWSNKALKEGVANLTNDGKNLNINLKDVTTAHLGLDKEKTKDQVVTAIQGSNSSLTETFKQLVDQETIGETNDDRYNTFTVVNSDDSSKSIITFTITLSNSDASKNISPKELKIVVANYKKVSV